jgi:phosphopantothenoylcysteine decarboxylase
MAGSDAGDKDRRDNEPFSLAEGSLITTASSAKLSRPRILIGCSGSVATLKLPELVVELSKYYEVLVICTQNAGFFLKRAANYNPTAWSAFESIGGLNLLLHDSDEWDMWNKVGNDVLHIELRRWADVLLIAPASANFLAKASMGCADNLLLSVVRAWDFNKPCFLCPAMNTFMWDHPVTAPTIKTLESWGFEVLGPVVKMLACKEVGNGAMISVDAIVHHIRKLDIAEHGSRSPLRKMASQPSETLDKSFPSQFPTLSTVIAPEPIATFISNHNTETKQDIPVDRHLIDKGIPQDREGGSQHQMLPILLAGISALFAIDGFIKMMK